MLRSSPFLVLPLLIVGGCSSGVPVTATVTTIDRVCTIIETRSSDDPEVSKLTKGRPVQTSRQGDCNEVEEWAEVKRKRSKSVDGKADIHFLYQGPDGHEHSGTLSYTGRDDEFYQVKAGDNLPIRVAEDDPTKVWRS